MSGCRAGGGQPSRDAASADAGAFRFRGNQSPYGPGRRRPAPVAFQAGGFVNRLIVVSNRVALPGEHRAGGLALALQAALAEHGGIWFGWSGRTVRDRSGRLHEHAAGNIRCITMDLNRLDYETYYNGFANRTLWPLLHFRLDLVDYSRGTREGYLRVNG